MSKTIGKTIRDAREKKNISRTGLAIKLKISSGYLAIIECDGPVWISERVLSGLNNLLKVKPSAYQVKSHNFRAAKYRRRFCDKGSKSTTR